jgi:hypothetical protein
MSRILKKGRVIRLQRPQQQRVTRDQLGLAVSQPTLASREPAVEESELSLEPPELTRAETRTFDSQEFSNVEQASFTIDNILGSIEPSTREQKDATAHNSVAVEDLQDGARRAPVFEENDQRNYMFISDRPVCDEVKKYLCSYHNLKEYDDTFVNRSCNDLIDNGIEHVWINLRVNRAKEWLMLNLKSDCFKKVLVYASNKRSKFLDDLEPHVDIKAKLSDLNKLKSLGIDELVTRLGQFVNIHDVPNSVASCFGCGSKLLKKKRK